MWFQTFSIEHFHGSIAHRTGILARTTVQDKFLFSVVSQEICDCSRSDLSIRAWQRSAHQHHHHLSLKRDGRWGTTDDFTTSLLHFSLFSTALWDLANSRPVHSLMFSSHLFLCLPCLLPPFTVPCKIVLARPDDRET